MNMKKERVFDMFLERMEKKYGFAPNVFIKFLSL